MCEVRDINEKLLFSVHRAGTNDSVKNLLANGGEISSGWFTNVVEKPDGQGPLLRKASIVRDPKGVIIGMLATDRTEPQQEHFLGDVLPRNAMSLWLARVLEAQPTSYSGYAARPRFAGQADAMTVEGVPMYAWFTFFAPGGGRVDADWWFPNGGPSFRNSMIYLHGPSGLEPQRAYDYRLEGPTPKSFRNLLADGTWDEGGSHFPWMFTVREAQEVYKGPMPGTSRTLIQQITGSFKALFLGGFVPRAPAGGTEAGVAYGDTLETGKEGKPPRHEVTIAQGMDAGLVVMAAFCPGLLNAEYHSWEDLREKDERAERANDLHES